MEIDTVLGVSPLYKFIHKLPMNMVWLFNDSTMILEQDPATNEPKEGVRAFKSMQTTGEGVFHHPWTTVTGCGILYHVQRKNL